MNTPARYAPMERLLRAIGCRPAESPRMMDFYPGEHQFWCGGEHAFAVLTGTQRAPQGHSVEVRVHVGGRTTIDVGGVTYGRRPRTSTWDGIDLLSPTGVRLAFYPRDVRVLLDAGVRGLAQSAAHGDLRGERLSWAARCVVDRVPEDVAAAVTATYDVAGLQAAVGALTAAVGPLWSLVPDLREYRGGGWRC